MFYLLYFMFYLLFTLCSIYFMFYLLYFMFYLLYLLTTLFYVLFDSWNMCFLVKHGLWKLQLRIVKYESQVVKSSPDEPTVEKRLLILDLKPFRS